MDTIAAVTRADRGKNARKPFVVLFGAEEKAALEKALAVENDARDVPIGLGTKLRLLGLEWAKARKKRR